MLQAVQGGQGGRWLAEERGSESMRCRDWIMGLRGADDEEGLPSLHCTWTAE